MSCRHSLFFFIKISCKIDVSVKFIKNAMKCFGLYFSRKYYALRLARLLAGVAQLRRVGALFRGLGEKGDTRRSFGGATTLSWSRAALESGSVLVLQLGVARVSTRFVCFGTAELR